MIGSMQTEEVSRDISREVSMGVPGEGSGGGEEASGAGEREGGEASMEGSEGGGGEGGA